MAHLCQISYGRRRGLIYIIQSVQSKKFISLIIVHFFIFICFAWYLAEIIHYLANEVFYPDTKIPLEYQGYPYYFSDEKMMIKTVGYNVFFIIFVVSWLFLWVRTKTIIFKVILVLESIIVFIAFLRVLTRVAIFVT